MVTDTGAQSGLFLDCNEDHADSAGLRGETGWAGTRWSATKGGPPYVRAAVGPGRSPCGKKVQDGIGGFYNVLRPPRSGPLGPCRFPPAFPVFAPAGSPSPGPWSNGPKAAASFECNEKVALFSAFPPLGRQAKRARGDRGRRSGPSRVRHGTNKKRKAYFPPPGRLLWLARRLRQARRSDQAPRRPQARLCPQADRRVWTRQLDRVANAGAETKDKNASPVR